MEDVGKAACYCDQSDLSDRMRPDIVRGGIMCYMSGIDCYDKVDTVSRCKIVQRFTGPFSC